jgi:UDP-N-acetylglucosamine--N-acetylmuramyl-(pentapeptide) pyrophosphoryl-undecaprenol N-acetylglucosamine transferase
MFACGGTGGHIFPAIAVAEELMKKKDMEIIFAGSGAGMEKGIIESRKFRFAPVSARPFIRKFTLENVKNFFMVIKAVFDSAGLIGNFNPDIVIGTGGFVSFPVVFAAVLMGKKTLIHEPNTYPGIANRALGAFVSAVTAGFEETAKVFPRGKTRVTGNPVRGTIINNSRKKAYREFGLSPRRHTILIMPGSRAARRINDVMIEAAPVLDSELKNIQVLWMAGGDDFERVKKAAAKSKVRINVQKFINDPGPAYAIADAAILRAGASTLSEIAACGAAAILVPYPHATGKHQEKNAEVFRARGAALVIKDSLLSKETLLEALKRVLNGKINKAMRKKAKQIYRGNSAEKIAAIAAGEAKK